MKTRYLACLALTAAAFGQVSTNSSLSGKYYFRQVLFTTDASGNVIDTRSASGSLTFDGNGNVTIGGQQLVGAAPPTAVAGNGAYTVKPGGFVTMTNPLRSGTTVNARLTAGGLAGSSTESDGTVFDLLIAVQAPAAAPSLAGPYWISSLEFPNAGVANVRNTNFKLTANVAGSFAENTTSGQAANLANRLQNQTVGPITYTVAADGTGTLTFPIAAGLDTTTQLIAGVKIIFVAQDGSWFLGGSTTAGGHGFLLGVKAWTSGATNASFSGLFFGAGLRVEGGRLAAYVGSANAAGPLGSVIWSRRLRQPDAAIDFTPVHNFSLAADGSGVALFKKIALASTGNVFTGSGVESASATSYEIYFGGRAPTQSGPGVFLNPQGVLNSASFAPAGNPISPGGFITLFGTGFGSQTEIASGFPFPPTLAGVEVTVNDLPAPVYSVSANPAQISAVVPQAVTGATARVVVIVNRARSNAVEVPLAPTAPGIFSLARNGIGAGAILHLDYSPVTAENPAKRGEYVQIYLTGLGPVSPPVPDGAQAPLSPLSFVQAPLNVYVGGVLVSNIQFKGLAPTLASLYQLNIQIPANAPVGTQALAVQTADAFTDMVDISIQ